MHVVSQAVQEHLFLRQGLSGLANEKSPRQIDLEAGYREMATDEAHEGDAHEWAEATVGDAYDVVR